MFNIMHNLFKFSKPLFSFAIGFQTLEIEVCLFRWHYLLQLSKKHIWIYISINKNSCCNICSPAWLEAVLGLSDTVDCKYCEELAGIGLIAKYKTITLLPRQLTRPKSYLFYLAKQVFVKLWFYRAVWKYC